MQSKHKAQLTASEVIMEFPDNPDLEQNMAAIKFRYRWYFKKFKMALEKHSKLYQNSFPNPRVEPGRRSGRARLILLGVQVLSYEGGRVTRNLHLRLLLCVFPA